MPPGEYTLVSLSKYVIQHFCKRGFGPKIGDFERSSSAGIDPLLTFKIGPTNGRKAEESGLPAFCHRRGSPPSLKSASRLSVEGDVEG
jgi:hypothetical protein